MSRQNSGILFKRYMEPELERLRERIRELEIANEALRQSEQRLATEQDTLQQVATRLKTAHGTGTLFEQILDTALAIMHSDFASIQMFYPSRGANGELRLLGHCGFSLQAAKRWEWVCDSTRTTCGEALRTGRNVVVPDVRKFDFMAGSAGSSESVEVELHPPGWLEDTHSRFLRDVYAMCRWF